MAAGRAPSAERLSAICKSQARQLAAQLLLSLTSAGQIVPSGPPPYFTMGPTDEDFEKGDADSTQDAIKALETVVEALYKS